MQAHGNLTASYLWQPGEFARRMLGERPSPVPPTRDIWPPPQQQLSISTLHVAYQQEDSYERRAATLPPQTYAPTHETYAPTTVPLDRPLQRAHSRPRVCTVGTNTDPPRTMITKLKDFFIKPEDPPIGHPPPGRLTAIPRETALDAKEEDNRARRAIKGIKKAISGAKYRIAPGTETVESPKIVYDMPKPGDRMTTTFGTRERKWCKIPSKRTCEKKIRGVSSWCAEQRPRRPQRRQPPPPATLQITQV